MSEKTKPSRSKNRGGFFSSLLYREPGTPRAKNISLVAHRSELNTQHIAHSYSFPATKLTSQLAIQP